MRFTRLSPWLVFLGIFLVIFTVCVRSTLPHIGVDYQIFFSRMIAGKWHILHLGFLPFRFTPHLCGGMVAYGYTQDLFYSLPQFLFLFLPLWSSIEISSLVFLVIGYLGWWLCGRTLLHLPKSWAHLFALVTIASGHYFVHIMAGHLTFQSLPLLGWMVFLFFDPREDTRNALRVRAVLFALTSAIMLYSGGILLVILTALTLLLLLPYVLLAAPRIGVLFRAIVLRAAACGAASALLCGSKIVAILSLARFFPRLIPFAAVHPPGGPFLYMAKSLWGFPQRASLFLGAEWNMEEHANFLSPVTLVGMAGGLFLLWHHRASLRAHPVRAVMLLAYTCFFLFLCANFATGDGALLHAMGALPVLSSLRVSTRFLYMLTLLVSAVGTVCLSLTVRTFFPRTERSLLLAAFVTTLASFPLALLPAVQTLPLQLPLDVVEESLHTHGYALPVTRIVEKNSEIFNALVGGTSLACYNSQFPFGTAAEFPTLYEGRVDDVRNGFFNIRNPACLQYPEENHCKPGDLIAETDRENFESFTQGRPTTWKISAAQHVADIGTLLSLLCAIGVLLVSAKHLPRYMQQLADDTP